MKALFVTTRAPRHQAIAKQAAPDFLDVELFESRSKDDLLARVAHTDVLISERSGQIDEEVILAGKNLKLIQRLGLFDHDIDLEAAKRAGVPVCVSPLLVSTLVSEHVMMQILVLAKTTREAAYSMYQTDGWAEPKRCDENYFAYNWSGRTGMRALAGSTVGIVGLGEIGADLARRLSAFGARVLYSKRTQLPESVEQKLNIEFADIDQIRAESDFLCLLLPHGPGMGESVDSEYIKKMKSGSYLISTGASTILNEQDAADAVRFGHLAGIAVDGYVFEPVKQDNPLLRLAEEQPDGNVVLTPHIAGGVASNDVTARMREFENVRRLNSGQPLIHQIA